MHSKQNVKRGGNEAKKASKFGIIYVIIGPKS
jgi:hypothetical protein